VSREKMTQTDFKADRTRHYQLLCNQTWIITSDKKEKIKNPSFAFLKISASAHLAHLQSRESQPTTRALQKSQILSIHIYLEHSLTL